MKFVVWDFCPVLHDVPFPTPERIPQDIRVYPLVIASSEQSAIIGLNPKRGYVLMRNGLKTEECNLKELDEMYPAYPTGAWGWEKEFVKGLKRRKRKADPYADDRELVFLCRSKGWKDVAYVERGLMFSEDGVQIFKEI